MSDLNNTIEERLRREEFLSEEVVALCSHGVFDRTPAVAAKEGRGILQEASAGRSLVGELLRERREEAERE